MGPMILLCVLLPLGVLGALCVGPHFWTRRDAGGDPEEGLVIFAESIRWLGVRWGARTAAAGLRAAGFEGEFRTWRWHAGWRGWLVLPAILDAAMLERESRRLAGFISAQRRAHPDRPLYVLGYSCGGYVAVRALELLGPDVRVTAAATLAGAYAPTRDLAPACRHVDGPLVVCSSVADLIIAGLGTLLFGTADRKHALSAGRVGVRPPADIAPRVRQLRWRPAMIACGHWGEHFSAAAAGFVRRHLAPALGIRPRPR